MQAQICAYANLNMAECSDFTRRNVYGSVVLSESNTLMEDSEEELDSSVDQSKEVCTNFETFSDLKYLSQHFAFRLPSTIDAVEGFEQIFSMRKRLKIKIVIVLILPLTSLEVCVIYEMSCCNIFLDIKFKISICYFTKGRGCELFLSITVHSQIENICQWKSNRVPVQRK